ncbi:SCNN1D [Bugula neritina]|uniref:SCNN1D n=1 Tax=Bugula neritina TaxID=10212 RepID=A0A7J7JD95_BUGNE|nr:SCNN1D [Bugula neritina]
MSNNIESEKKTLAPKLKGVVQSFSESTSAHGPPKIVGHKYLIGKIFWLLLFITGLCTFTYFSAKLISQYNRHEMTTDVQVEYGAIKFPAVTFCNINQFQPYKYCPRPDAWYEKMAAYWTTAEAISTTSRTKETITDTNTLPPTSNMTHSNSTLSTNSTDNTLVRKRRYAVTPSEEEITAFEELEKIYSLPTFSPDHPGYQLDTELMAQQRVLRSYTLVQLLTQEELVCRGHSLEDMLVDCTFHGEKCKTTDFYQFYDRRFGNCFTYNSGLNGSYEETKQAGQSIGLSLTLFIDQANYDPHSSYRAGATFLLHPQGEFPQIAEKGFKAAPGFQTSVAISYGCYMTCIQRQIVEKCGCLSMQYAPIPGEVICDYYQYYHCVVNFKTDIDSCSCPLPCQESQYHHSISFSEWPAINFEDFWRSAMRMIGVKSIQQGAATWTRERIRSELVTVDFYFESLNYNVYIQRASMTLEDLIGSIGGHLGLWIGMSIISFMEVFELIVILFAACGKFIHRKRTGRSADVETKMDSEL